MNPVIAQSLSNRAVAPVSASSDLSAQLAKALATCQAELERLYLELAVSDELDGLLANIKKREKACRVIEQKCLALQTAAPKAAAIQPAQVPNASETCEVQAQEVVPMELDKAAGEFVQFYVHPQKTEDGKPGYYLHVFYGNYEPLKTRVCAGPEINLEHLFDTANERHRKKQLAKHPAKDVWETVVAYSDTEELQHVWRQLVLLHQARAGVYLLIQDRTPYAIPWEILQIQFGKYLGACFNTVRWAEDSQQPSEEQANRSGHALSYILSGLKESVQEYQFFRDVVQAVLHENLSAFSHSLEQQCDDCALIYLACHGFIQQDDIALGCPNTPGEQLSYKTLRAASPLLRVQNSGSLVFINTCVSAYQQTVSVHNNAYWFNFPRLFLRNGAGGVIGTLASVYSTHAAAMAQTLLKRIQADDPLPVAALLREIRAEAIAALNLNAPDDAFEQAFTKFCYVYYGLPKLHIAALQPAGQQP